MNFPVERNVPYQKTWEVSQYRYAWSSARAHVLGIKDDVLSESSWLDEKEAKSYRIFLKQEDEEMNASIRRATSTGRPLGSEGLNLRRC